MVCTIIVKLPYFGKQKPLAMGVLLGLPIVRTSVDHGTAFDIAWQGVASEESLVEAIRLAAQLAAVVIDFRSLLDRSSDPGF